MRTRRALTLLLALVLALSLLSGCAKLRSVREDMLRKDDASADTASAGETDDGAASEAPAKAETVETDLGEVVTDGSAIYYWRYRTDSFESPATFAAYQVLSDAKHDLIRRENGEETVLLTCAGTGKLCLADGRLYFQRVDAETVWRYVLCSVAPDGSDLQEYGSGSIRGVSEDGRYLFGVNEMSAPICIDTAAQTLETLGGETAIYVTNHDDTVYYSVFDYSEEPAMSLYAQRVGGEPVLITHAVQENMPSSPSVAEVRFADVGGESWMYFSYGPIDGSGIFYQGGQIARVHTDGTGFEVLAGADEPVFSDFTVQPDGSIKLVAANERIGEGLYVGLTAWYTSDGTIYAIDPANGESVQLLSKDGYADFSGLNADQIVGDQEYLRVMNAEVHGDDAYVRLQYSTRDASADLGWREGFALRDGVLLHVSLNSGAVETLYTYSA